MQAHHFHKPENVLRRANDLVSVGKKEIALQLLHDMLCTRRHRTWQKAHEEIMCVYLQLCVDLKNNRMAKEGLHQYRNISQQQAPGSLEIVIDFMLKLADERARKAAHQCNKKVVEDVEDLENDTTPESILLATVTSEKEKERAEREFLVPWLKFLWETYRTVLEILRNNPKLEHVYHNTAHKAFAFCAEYERNTEFRRLCEILRNHLINQQKYGKDQQGNLTPETMELHLSTRFEQLKVASSLRLWHEGFRTIEDIHQIMSISNKRPSSQLMATYYQKLTHLFLISENFLFHAYAYKAFYVLSRERNKSLTLEQTQTMASCVLLAAMSIPLQSSKAGTTFVEEGLQKEKNRRMAQLLGFDINPKRKSLLQDLLNKNILLAVLPEVKELYECLENKFEPLTLISNSLPLLKYVRENEKLKVYSKALENLLVVRLVSQLSKVYYSVKLDHFKQLLAGLETPFLEVEKIVARAVKNRQINVHGLRIDHQSGCIRFGEDVMEEKRTRKLLLDMAHGLSDVCKEISPVDPLQAAQSRAQMAQSVIATVASRHRQILNRKAEIEKRKEDFEKHQIEKARQLAVQRAEEARIQKELDNKKMEAAKAALVARQQKLVAAKAENLDEKTALIEKGYRAEQVLSLGQEELEKLIAKTKEKAEKEVQETQRKIQASSRRLDALVRAIREKEIPKRKELYKKFIVDERESYETQKKTRNEKAVAEHEFATARKSDTTKMQPVRDDFEAPWIEKWKVEHAESCKLRAKELVLKRFQQKIVRARRRRMEKLAEEQRKQEAEERRVAEEQRRLEREEDARIAADKREELKSQQNAPAASGSVYSRIAARSGTETASSDGKWVAPSRRGGGGQEGGWRARQQERASGGYMGFPKSGESESGSWRRGGR